MKRLKIFFLGLAVIIQSNLCVSAAPVGPVTVRPAAAIEKTPAENMFRIEGSSQDFILLDHDEEGFFVTSKEFYGLHVYDPDNTGKYDIEDTNNMAYWLNNDFLEEGNTYNGNVYQLPEVIKNHLVERDWLCEAGYVSTDYAEDYSVRAKIALMSMTEWNKYFSKLGFKDDITSNYYFLRSVNGKDNPGVNSGIMLVSVQEGITVSGKAFNPYGIRPVFYLDNNFFINEKIDIDAMGDNVAKVLREAYTREEFSKRYSDSEIDKICKKLPPQAKRVKMLGIPQAGKTIKASYVYESPENEPEGKSDCRWLRSKNVNGPYSLIPGENSLEYKIKPEDTGYYIIFELVPKSVNSIGRAVRSSPTIVPVEEAAAPYAENVYLDGEAVTGERVIARYEYWDDNDDIESGTKIVWQCSDDGESYSDIEEGEAVDWIIPEEYAGKYIRFTVTVKNEEDGGIGIPVASEPIGPVKLRPTAEPAEIVLDGDKVVMTSEPEGINYWEIELENGECVIAQLGGREYRLSGRESGVRVRTIPYSEGIYGTGVSSNKIELNIKQFLNEGKSEIEIDGDCEIALVPENGELAYTLSLSLICEGVTVEGITSTDYKTFISETETGVKCILTKASDAGMKMPEEVMLLKVNGTGKIFVEKAEGVYRNTDGRYVKNTPKLIFVKK